MRGLQEVQSCVVLTVAYTVAAIAVHKDLYSDGRRNEIPTVCRNRVSVSEIFQKLGSVGVRRAYRMHPESFWLLSRILFQGNTVKKRKRGKTPNGPIDWNMRLAMALRWFAGVDKFDIALNYDVHVTEVMNSVWDIVDRINFNEALSIKFPTCHHKQQEIADNFEKNHVFFSDNCTGCVDGMLVWITKPSKSVLEGTSIGEWKFYCGRGGNME